MKSLRRYDLKNRLYFITVVTFNRRRIILENLDLIWGSWKILKPMAWVLMPDHLHFLFNIEDENISDIIHDFKIRYSRKYRDSYGGGRVWQNRFWDHIIRNQDDLNIHIDYIHYNPVKHGLVSKPFDWKHSSIHDYREVYPDDWGVLDRLEFSGEYGE